MNLWVATRNRHKLEEIAGILGPAYELKSLLDRPDIPEVEEDGATYRDNARKKARALWEHVKAPVFADDSGLEVDALGGRPGVHSMRYSAPQPTHAKNIVKLLGEMQGIPLLQRTARFRCTVVYLDTEGNEQVFEGVLEGVIGFEAQGEGGFGFDPVFVLPERGITVAQLSPEEKNQISHRGRAVMALRRYLEQRAGGR
ncbi:MAG: Nucleoside 5-triphosphatase RdgB (dHAPTP, dITP, XTP-specific) [Candidatus Ozemobacter sibiricus]|jgi:XTP/dITP diphosphohydrolase|uniref:dITP/XTP pyrophosphatase n=1 Tax=Candidatus Ozemobacter sibiricus TaxID=2268124 RepID=A0A367Z8G5_9BACT|nr:MAG: Nucleoside 5-triphosphatase RdgB (dHAPTP, dITP, XTP-specific) [Candidatus Ozemobacter sibiricus]